MVSLIIWMTIRSRESEPEVEGSISRYNRLRAKGLEGQLRSALLLHSNKLINWAELPILNSCTSCPLR